MTNVRFAPFCVYAVLFAGSLAAAPQDPRPNVLLCIADDLSYQHTGAAGDPLVKTPAFDRVAREGVLFRNAYCAAPSCGPSRAAILTGRPIWQLEHGAVMRSHLPAKFTVYPALLEGAGYHVGCYGKGYGPGKLTGWKHNPAGKNYRSFDAFLDQQPHGKPFCFWFGSINPHRPYEKSFPDVESRLAKVVVPPFLPDLPEVRRDLLDYLYEAEQFDAQLARLLGVLEKRGLLDNTLVIVTSDNGLPFPRAKCNLYDAGTRMPLAVRWKARVPGGRTVDDFVSLADLAPTILQAAGAAVPPEMAARSFLDVLFSTRSGQVDPARDWVVTARERHSVTRGPGLGYPMRAVRTRDFLYIRNYAPDRGPTGTPPGTADVDESPTKKAMLEHRQDPGVARLYALAFENRPAEELYDLRQDSDQLHNVAGQPAYADRLKQSSDRLKSHLKATADPRETGGGEAFDRYPFYSTPRDKPPERK